MRERAETESDPYERVIETRSANPRDASEAPNVRMATII
jgi:hypothetical protein